jgi:hypothetical protein
MRSSWSVTVSIGLVMWPTQPASKACRRSAGTTLAVSAIAGMERVAGSCRNRHPDGPDRRSRRPGGSRGEPLHEVSVGYGQGHLAGQDPEETEVVS